MYDLVHKMIGQIESMSRKQISATHAIDMIESKARSYDELLIINVIRESFLEVAQEESARKMA